MKMCVSATVILLLIWHQASVKSLRLLEMRVPAHVAEGSEALLSCQFDTEEDSLYSVKWYKDYKEFYRYIPRSDPNILYFPTPGVFVDVSRSSSDVVILTNLTDKSAGRYRCEVSGEAPNFSTVSDEKDIAVYLIPERGPRITGLKSNYKVGDHVAVNCTSSGSRPETILKWLLNDQPARQEYIQGPWYRSSAVHSDATVTILQMRFTVKPEHFKYGSMKLKCLAIIAPLYQKETVHNAWKPLPLPPTTQAPELELDRKDVLIHIPESEQAFQLYPTAETTQESLVNDDIEDHATSMHKSLSMLFLTGLLLVV